MHLKPIRTAVTPTSPNGFWPAYNLFRCKRSLDLFCAVPEDYPVPTFIDADRWQFAGKVDKPSDAPLGFKRETARAIVHLTGFYLFTGARPEQESAEVEAIRLAA